jgi:preprotein translocase SecE subunit
VPSRALFNNRNAAILNTIMGLVNYIKETRGELKHVSWPTRSQALAYTIIVILISLGLSFFLGLFDSIFLKGSNFSPLISKYYVKAKN